MKDTGSRMLHGKTRAKSAKFAKERPTMNIETSGKNVLDTAFAIHTAFGSGLLEKAYRVILAAELRRLGHVVEEEKTCGFSFNGAQYENMFRVDLLVDDAVIVELKSVCRNERVFAKQCLTYMRLLDKRLGFVINFGMPSLRDGIVRLVNNLEKEDVPDVADFARGEKASEQGENFAYLANFARGKGTSE